MVRNYALRKFRHYLQLIAFNRWCFIGNRFPWFFFGSLWCLSSCLGGRVIRSRPFTVCWRVKLVRTFNTYQQKPVIPSISNTILLNILFVFVIKVKFSGPPLSSCLLLIEHWACIGNSHGSVFSTIVTALSVRRLGGLVLCRRAASRARPILVR